VETFASWQDVDVRVKDGRPASSCRHATAASKGVASASSASSCRCFAVGSFRTKLIWEFPSSGSQDFRPARRSRSPGRASYARDERLYLFGMPLTLLPSILLTPAWLYLVYAPRFAHARLFAIPVLAGLAWAEWLGTKQLLRCTVHRPGDMLSGLCMAVMTVSAIFLMFAVVFLFLLYWAGPIPRYAFLP
jgi:hypothetical protein